MRALLCLALLTPLPALALTPPNPGAAALPEKAELKLPFPAGAQIQIVAGYGPAMGSSLHADTSRADKANDHYALDLSYEGAPEGGLGMPVAAPLAGVVVKAGWATAGWANYGQRIILAHDLGDGHVYHSLYAHLDAIDPLIMEGAQVSQGQVLGALGRSCQGQLSCGSFSYPHLHFALHQDSMVGGSGTGGSYGGRAVVPEPFDGAEDLLRGDVLSSTNVTVAVCGDGLCTMEQETCPEDCPVCAPIPAEGRIIDDGERCFSRGGDPAYWRFEQAGFGGGLYWTHATDAAAVDNFVIWSLDFAEAGDYLLEVYTAQPFARSAQARYLIEGAAPAEVLIDQRAINGWQSLGRHSFLAGSASVRLNDNTGEPFSDRVQIAFDALRISPAGQAKDGGLAEDLGTPDQGEVDLGTQEPSAPDAGLERPDLGARPKPAEGGCGCSASERPSSALWLLALLLLGAHKQRRERR